MHDPFKGFEVPGVFCLDAQRVAFDQPARQRAAEQAARHHAEGGRRQCSGGRPHGPQVFGNRAERRRCAEPAFQRDRPRHDPQQRVDAQRLGHAHADHVLHQRQPPARPEVDKQQLAALA